MIVVKYEMQQQLSETHSETEVTVPDTAALVSVTWFEDGKWKGGKFDPNLLVLVKQQLKQNAILYFATLRLVAAGK